MIRCGIAGLGKWGQTLVTSVQGKSDKIVFTAGVTGRKERAQAFCDEHRIDLRDDYDGLLNDDALDAVVLATPHSQHAQQIMAAATVGKPVFAEKPLTLDARDARECAETMSGAGLPLCVGFNRRFLPAMQKLRDLAQSGTLGTIVHIEGNISGNGALRYTDDHWRASDTESPAGGMTAMGVHMMDAMISIMGRVDNLQSVSERHAASVPVDDTTFASLKFESGATGVLTTIFATHSLWRIQVFGSKGWAEVRDNRRLEVRLIGNEAEVTEFAPFDMERAELEAFADVLTEGAPFLVPVDDVVHGIDILNAVSASATRGERVNLPKE